MSVVFEENWNSSSEEKAVEWGREVLIEGIFQSKRSGKWLVKWFRGKNSLGGIKKTLLCSAKQTVFFITISLVESMVKSILVIKSSRSFKNLSYSSAEFCMSLIRSLMISSKVMRSEGIFLRIDFICFWDISESMSVFVENEHVSIIGESLFWFPRCFGDRISFPFHVVLITSSSFSMIDDQIYFIDFFFVFKFCRRFREIRSVDIVLFVGSEEGGMEDIMDLPRRRELC